jgi:hypothetical protein
MINAIDPKDKWFLDRYGNFTASENFKLLVGGSKGEMFGTGAITYITDKAIETMTVLHERPELEQVKSLLWGKVYEYPAYECYVNVTKNYNMRYLGSETPLYLAYNEYSGGSPDGIMGRDTTIEWGAEFKCPKTSKVHFEYLKLKDQWDLKSYSIQNYTQVQMLLMTTKAEGFDFFSYDERFKDARLKYKIIEVKPDKRFQDNLAIRLQCAQRDKLEIIQSMKAA